jgi:hypothetical protein
MEYNVTTPIESKPYTTSNNIFMPPVEIINNTVYDGIIILCRENTKLPHPGANPGWGS